MAVERTGTAVSISTTSDTGSQSVTVPNDCTCVVLFHMGAHDGTDDMFGSGGATFTIGGASFTWQGRTTANQDYMDAAVLTKTSPATGAQTFAWAGCSESSTDPLLALIFYKGVDTTSPVADVDGVHNSQTITGLTAPSGSMTVAAGISYINPIESSGASQTVILNNISSANTSADVFEKADSTGVAFTGGDYPSIIAIVLAPVSATATLNQYSFRFYNDDGSESAATAKGDINTNVNLAANDISRIRFLIDATLDPTGKQFQLEYRRKPSGGSFGSWTKV